MIVENKEIQDLIKIFDDSSLSEVKIKDKDFSIYLSKQTHSAPVVSVPSNIVQAPIIATASQVAEATTPVFNGLQVNSPMVGTFYSASNPESKPFASVGDVIKKGQALAIIEAMKIMNEIDAEYDMKIIKVLVKNGDPVEFDMPLFEVEKS
jgi:acetyl-CoA carboxylase biotin carboxyl carrier protein